MEENEIKNDIYHLGSDIRYFQIFISGFSFMLILLSFLVLILKKNFP